MKYTEMSVINATTILPLAVILYVTILFSQRIYQYFGSAMVPSTAMNGDVFVLEKRLASDGSCVNIVCINM